MRSAKILQRALTFALALLCTSAGLAVAQQSERITGTVRSDSGGVIPNASITVTPAGAGSTASVTTRSTANGQWTVMMAARADEYFVTVSAIGWIQTRVTTKSTGGAGPVVVDVALKRAPVLLGPVRVTEQRRQPPQRDVIGADVAATEKGILASSEVFAVGDQGSLTGMIAQVPGVLITSDPSSGLPQFSVLGLSGAQNNVTLNGLSFGGGDVPRDIIGAVRVSSSTYDVSRGGFSGAQLSVTQAPGSNFNNWLAHVTYDTPSLQATDHVGRQLGQQYTNAQVSGGAAGPILWDRLFYNVSFQGGRRYSDLTSLLTGDPDALSQLGVSKDSVAALVHAMQLRGIPVAASGIPDRRQTDNGSLLARLDWTPSQTAVGNIVASLRRNASEASFVAPTAAPGHGGDLTRDGGDITGQFSAFIHTTILNDTRLGAHTDALDGTPYTNMPDARVLVVSQLADGTTGLTALSAGGNAALPRTSRTSGAEFFNQTSWNSLDNRHRWRATLDARLDRLSQNQGANTRGTFVYNSIADVEANRPSSFTRSFATNTTVADVQTGSVALGDQWRVTDRLTVTYGARLDANGVPTNLAYNASVDSAFHLRTDHAPREAIVSPRASFSWGFGSNGTTGIPGFGAPWGFLTGGIGEFRNDIRPGLIAPVIANTGLSDGVRQLLCVGSAVPIPDYSVYADNPSAIPTACSSGGLPSYSTNRSNVWLIDPNFESQRSWRGNLTLRGPFVTKLFRFSADATFSRNLHQQSPVDVNFNPIVRGQLSAEGNRPLYASPASIVSTTGAVTNVDSRASQLFGSVNALRSDLESHTAQYTFALNPIGLSTQRARWTMTYVYSDVREQTRGFGGTTAGSPLDVEWGRGPLSIKHQFNVNLYTRWRDILSFAVTGRALSGAPFTPVVAGDINGDGISNDRAFVFTPSTSDPTTAAGMSKLLASASPRVRDCLTRQFGSIAKRNSCEGPWTATAAASITLNPEKLGWENRATLSLNVSNPLAGIDELMHGSSHLQGWGQAAAPDPTLLRVRGFDPVAGAFKYDVNQRFGDTRLASSGLRVPFIVSVEARIRLGHDFERQGIDNIVGPGRNRRGERLSAQQIRVQLINSVFNPLRGILQVKDSLSVLSQAQIDRLTQLQRRLVTKQDSIWAPIVTYFTTLPDNYVGEEVVERSRTARMAAYDVMVEAMVEVSKILTPEQIADFPPALRSSFDVEGLRAQRPTKGFFPAY